MVARNATASCAVFSYDSPLGRWATLSRPTCFMFIQDKNTFSEGLVVTGDRSDSDLAFQYGVLRMPGAIVQSLHVEDRASFLLGVVRMTRVQGPSYNYYSRTEMCPLFLLSTEATQPLHSEIRVPRDRP